MSLPVLEDRKFLGSIVVDGTTSLTGTLTSVQLATNTIADPGTGAAIPVTQSGVCAITTAGAETNTLAIPTFIGQRIVLVCDTYAVGDRVITVAAAFNVANITILTFGAVSEACE